MKNNYEIMMIISPPSPEFGHAEAIRAKEEIERNAGAVTSLNAWGERVLAFPINDVTQGYYMIINFKGNKQTADNVDKLLKSRVNVLRHLVVKKAA